MQRILSNNQVAEAVVIVDANGNIFTPAGAVTQPKADRSGAIQAGGSAQVLMPANASRIGFFVQNMSAAGPLYVNETGAASAAAGSFMLAAATASTPGGSYESPPGGAGTGSISIFGATTGQAFTAKEW